jgi:hypothetical protein
MVISFTTAISRFIRHPQEWTCLRKVKIWLCMLICLFLTGCPSLPLLWPKTSVHGIVIDQEGQPVPSIELRANYYPPRWYMFPPGITEHFRADSGGKWRFSARKVGDLYILAIPPDGYKRLPAVVPDHGWPERVGPFHDGDCPTNDFVLRIQRIEPPTQPKETK